MFFFLRLSTTSTFESGPIACSSMLSRASLDPGSSLGQMSEFAIPKNPVRHKMMRGVHDKTKLGSPSTNNSISAEEVDSLATPDVNDEVPDEAMDSSTDGPARPAPMKDIKVASPTSFTELKVPRKRGRKPKIPDVIREGESSSSGCSATPAKKGRRGRPPGDATPHKKEASAGDRDEEAKEGKEAQQTPSPPRRLKGGGDSDDPGRNSDPEESEKSADDYVKEVAGEWRDIRNRSYEIGKRFLFTVLFMLLLLYIIQHYIILSFSTNWKKNYYLKAKPYSLNGRTSVTMQPRSLSEMLSSLENGRSDSKTGSHAL